MALVRTRLRVSRYGHRQTLVGRYWPIVLKNSRAFSVER
jgi:hypothetical protein